MSINWEIWTFIMPKVHKRQAILSKTDTFNQKNGFQNKRKSNQI